jgi:osmotically-inducible protein OsmY
MSDKRSERRSPTRWLVGLPFRLTADLLVGAFKAGWWSAKLPVRVTARTTRLVGLKAVVLFVAGLAVGLLFAPVSGAELRARLQRRLEGDNLTDSELADKVGYELAHAPRTWHLPQPEVAVLQGRVELSGQVPHERGREELERVAAAVPGVLAVENSVIVDGDEAGAD